MSNIKEAIDAHRHCSLGQHVAAVIAAVEHRETYSRADVEALLALVVAAMLTPSSVLAARAAREKELRAVK
jgi:hypothetical protein